MRRIHRISGIEGVGANALVSVKLPTQRRYHGLKFFVTNNGAAVIASDVIDRATLKVNGKSQRELTAARILQIATLTGVAAATGELPVNFSEPSRADKMDEQMLAWNLYGETSFEVFLKLKAGLVNPTVTGLAIWDDGQTLDAAGNVVKNIIRQFELTKNAAIGPNDFDNIPRDFPLHRVLLDAAGAVSDIDVRADDNTVQELTSAENARILADYGLVSTAFAFPICFDFTEQVTDGLVARRSLNVRFTSAAAQQVTAVLEQRVSSFGD